jgi:acetyl esterase/lipase
MPQGKSLSSRVRLLWTACRWLRRSSALSLSNPDVVYSSPAGHRPLRLDLYQPPGNRTAPLVVFVHGGGWAVGTKRTTANYADWPGVLAAIAEKGFVVVSVEYRLSGEAAFPAPVQDILAAVRFLRAQSGTYGIDPNRVVLWGGSAGAHLAALAAFACHTPAFGGDASSTEPCAQGFVGWYGPYDIAGMFAAMMKAPAGSLFPEQKRELDRSIGFFGCPNAVCPPGALENASPLTYVTSASPPALLLHGDADTVAPVSQSQALDNALKAAGVAVEMVTYPGVNHGWVGASAEVTGEASRRALTRTIEYLEMQFAKR